MSVRHTDIQNMTVATDTEREKVRFFTLSKRFFDRSVLFSVWNWRDSMAWRDGELVTGQCDGFFLTEWRGFVSDGGFKSISECENNENGSTDWTVIGFEGCSRSELVNKVMSVREQREWQLLLWSEDAAKSRFGWQTSEYWKCWANVATDAYKNHEP